MKYILVLIFVKYLNCISLNSSKYESNNENELEEFE